MARKKKVVGGRVSREMRHCYGGGGGGEVRWMDAYLLLVDLVMVFVKGGDCAESVGEVFILFAGLARGFALGWFASLGVSNWPIRFHGESYSTDTLWELQ